MTYNQIKNIREDKMKKHTFLALLGVIFVILLIACTNIFPSETLKDKGFPKEKIVELEKNLEGTSTFCTITQKEIDAVLIKLEKLEEMENFKNITEYQRIVGAIPYLAIPDKPKYHRTVMTSEGKISPEQKTPEEKESKKYRLGMSFFKNSKQCENTMYSIEII